MSFEGEAVRTVSWSFSSKAFWEDIHYRHQEYKCINYLYQRTLEHDLVLGYS